MDSKAGNILKTLLYFDIFDYPLTKGEIYKFLTGGVFSQKELSYAIDNLQKNIEGKSGYFFVKGRKEIVNKRRERETISVIKFKKAKQIIKNIIFIPSIKFIGISGALSMNNATLDDDIDIFVITEKNLIWITRFLIIIVLKILGVYRGKKDKSYKDKICLNMIVAENKLVFDKKNRNLYTAHEIVQLVPVFNKDKTYEKFLFLNNWVNDFLPNSKDYKKIIFKKDKSLQDRLWVHIFNVFSLEKLFHFIQFNYMKADIGKEVIMDGLLGFHPFDYKTYVLGKYSKRLQKYNLKITKEN